MGPVGLVGHWGHAWKGFAPGSVPLALFAFCSLLCALCPLLFKLLWFLPLVGFFSMHYPDNSFIFAISLLKFDYVAEGLQNHSEK
jgi:hypothetical protein